MDRTALREKAAALATADPLLPHAQPTTAFWQQPVHERVGAIQSPALPAASDVVIIGSGVTGCSVTKALLETTGWSVTVLEARTLVSGATGRNGGHLVSAAGHKFAGLVAQHGVEHARAIARFSLRNIARVQDMVAALPEHVRARSEVRPVTKLVAFADEDAWTQAEASLSAFEREVPEYKDHHWRVDEKELEETWGIHAKGGIAQNAGALWPYRLFTDLFAHLLDTYPDRLSIETNTPALSVARDADRAGGGYRVETPRGTIRAQRVVYCTNGYTSHLLPTLRGPLYPYRGHMSVQDASALGFPNQGAQRSWSYVVPGLLDAAVPPHRYRFGLYYLQQNAATGDLFIGVEDQPLADCLCSDDSFVSAAADDRLLDLLPRMFGTADRPRLKSIWSGVMGMTADGLPLVGRLSSRVTGRTAAAAAAPDEGEEWIAAGFNGYGMDKTWLTGEAVAHMVAGQGVPDWFPQAYLLTDERLAGDRMRLDGLLDHLAVLADQTEKAGATA